MHDTGNVGAAPMHDANPIAYDSECGGNVVVVGANILSRNIGAEFLIAIRFAVEDETSFPALRAIPEFPCAQENAQLERHVEARQTIVRVERRSGQVVYPELALADDPIEFVDSDLSAVLGLERTSGYETTVVDREYECAQKFLVPSVKRNVDKDRIG